METKRLTLDTLELRLDGEAMQFQGYASVFGGIDAYGDTIDPKAYERTLKRKASDRPIRLRWNHFGPVIGKWVDMVVDAKGLLVTGQLTPGHSVAMDAYASMKHGAVDGLSIGFYPKQIEMLEGDRRLLKEIELVEISVVEDPADLGAKIGDVKSILDAAKSLKEIETLLREAGGFSRADAVSLVARIKSMCQSESDAESKARDELSRILRESVFIPS